MEWGYQHFFPVSWAPSWWLMGPGLQSSILIWPRTLYVTPNYSYKVWVVCPGSLFITLQYFILFHLLFFKYIFIYLVVLFLVVAHRIFHLHCGMRSLSCSLWDLLIVLWSGIEPRPLALGAQVLSHWTTSKVLFFFVFLKSFPFSVPSGCSLLFCPWVFAMNLSSTHAHWAALCPLPTDCFFL